MCTCRLQNSPYFCVVNYGHVRLARFAHVRLWCYTATFYLEKVILTKIKIPKLFSQSQNSHLVLQICNSSMWSELRMQPSVAAAKIATGGTPGATGVLNQWFWYPCVLHPDTKKFPKAEKLRPCFRRSSHVYYSFYLFS